MTAASGPCRTALAAAAVLLSTGCAPPDPIPAGEPGPLVVIGGALEADNDAVYREVLAGLAGPGPLCVIPTASGSPRESVAAAAERFQSRIGGDREVQGILITVANAGDARTAALADALGRCAGFFFTGGSQSRILDVFRPAGEDTPAFQALWERWRDGAVVAGTSAGAAMMSRRSIVGGSSSGALAHGLRDREEGEGVWVREGLGFTDRFVVDQHFLARGRWGRLAVALLADPHARAGAGIDENTALVVQRGTARVIGASGVVWMRETGEPGTLRLDLLGRGDRVDLATGMTTRARGRLTLEGESPVGTAGPDDGTATGPGGGPAREPAVAPFDRWALLHLLEALGRSPDRSIRLDAGPGAGGTLLVLEKLPGFTATRRGGADGDAGGVRGAPPGLSVGPLLLRVGAPALR